MRYKFKGEHGLEERAHAFFSEEIQWVWANGKHPKICTSHIHSMAEKCYQCMDWRPRRYKVEMGFPTWILSAGCCSSVLRVLFGSIRANRIQWRPLYFFFFFFTTLPLGEVVTLSKKQASFLGSILAFPSPREFWEKEMGQSCKTKPKTMLIQWISNLGGKKSIEGCWLQKSNWDGTEGSCFM